MKSEGWRERTGVFIQQQMNQLCSQFALTPYEAAIALRQRLKAGWYPNVDPDERYEAMQKLNELQDTRPGSRALARMNAMSMSELLDAISI